MRLFKNWMTVFVLLSVALAACDKDDTGSPNGGGNGNNANGQGTGESAEALLQGDDYPQMRVEIQYVEGFKPTDEALDSFKNFLNRYLYKPDGIHFTQSSISQPGQDQYSIDDIISIEESNRNVYNDGNEIGVYFLFLDGEYEENSSAIGIAYRNTSMVIFEEKIQNISGGIGEPDQSTVETSVINHEMGHNLGLVNNGTPMQKDHQDEKNGKHCDNDNCLMYYAIEQGDLITNFLGSSAPALDQNCQNDLKANGGK